ncbi:MAG: DUF1450 domain-containing protein [Bacillota bacterium]
MKQIELCEHNLKQETAKAAASRLEANVVGKAELVTVGCIHSCKACHAGALIARVGEEIISDPDNEVVIARITRLIEA